MLAKIKVPFIRQHHLNRRTKQHHATKANQEVVLTSHYLCCLVRIGSTGQRHHVVTQHIYSSITNTCIQLYTFTKIMAINHIQLFGENDFDAANMSVKKLSFESQLLPPTSAFNWELRVQSKPNRFYIIYTFSFCFVGVFGMK